MGLDLVYKSGRHELTIDVLTPTWNAVSLLRENLADAVSTMVDCPDIGEEQQVPVQELRDAIELIIGLLQAQPDLLPTTYEYKVEYLTVGDRGIEFDEFSSGTVSGIRLPGDEEHRYSVQAGLDECVLLKMAVQPDGTGKFTERRDLRGERSLATANCGRLLIRTRSTASGLLDELGKIRRFLDDLPHEAVVSKVVC